MKGSLLFVGAFALCCFSLTVHGQSQEPASEGYDSLAMATPSRADSLNTRVNGKIDSVQMRVNSLLSLDLRTLRERVARRRTKAADTLDAKRELDSIKGALSRKTDSLKRLNLPTGAYTAALDSVNKLTPATYMQRAEQESAKLQSRIAQPLTTAEQKLNEPLSTVESKLTNAQGKVNDKLDVLREQGGTGANVPGNLDATPQLNVTGNLPGNNLPTVPGSNAINNVPSIADVNVGNPLNGVNNPLEGNIDQLDELKGKATDLRQVPQEQVNKLKQADAVQNISGKVGEGNKIVDQAQAYQQDAMSIAQGDLGEVKKLPADLEQKALQTDALKELQTQNGIANEQMNMVKKANDPEALKREGKKVLLTQAKDHFAGKEAVLNEAMEKMSKLKSRYSEVKSLADLPKRLPNAMKGKPFIERIIPGITLQFQKATHFMVDVNPSFTYRISGRVSAGAGWNERFSFPKWNALEPFDRIYGPRAFAGFTLKKGFSVKAEGEKMNTFVPTFMGSSDGSRMWVWSVFVGLKKDYQFIGRVRGNAQILYNIYDDHDNSPYVDRLNVRMGFEFPMKKTQRRKQG